MNKTKTWIMREHKFERDEYGRSTAKYQRDVIKTTEFDQESEAEVIDILSQRVYLNWSYYLFPTMGIKLASPKKADFVAGKIQATNGISVLEQHPKLLGKSVNYTVVSPWNNNTAPFFCELLIDGVPFVDTRFVPWNTSEEAKQATAIIAFHKLQTTASIDEWKVFSCSTKFSGYS